MTHNTHKKQTHAPRWDWKSRFQKSSGRTPTLGHLDRLAQSFTVCVYTVLVILKLYSSRRLNLSEKFWPTQMSVPVAVWRFRIETFSLLHKFNPWVVLTSKVEIIIFFSCKPQTICSLKNLPIRPRIIRTNIVFFFIFYKIFLLILLKLNSNIGYCYIVWPFFLLCYDAVNFLFVMKFRIHSEV